MNKNSIEIYYNKIRPDIKKKHDRVLYALAQLGEGNLYDIAEALNTAPHNISGRLTELSGTKEYGKPIIHGVGMKLNKYGNPCTLWRIKEYQPQGEQPSLFNNENKAA